MITNSPTILENGDGLFETHVHLEDVQESIFEQLNSKAKLGEDTKYTVVGDGNGFMSRVIVVEPDWTVPDEHFPSKFILKIPSSFNLQILLAKIESKEPMPPKQKDALLKMFETQTQMLHNNEVNFYEIAKKWNRNSDLLSPNIYFSKKFDLENKIKGFLGMEYVEETTVRHLYINVTPHELQPVLRSLATLQALSLRLTDEEKKSISGYDFKNLLGYSLREDGMKRRFEQARSMNPLRLSEKVDKVEAFGMEVVNLKLACNVNEYAGIQQDVLVHGDLWATNILWKYENGDFSVNKLIDYQLIHMGNPAEDLVRLFISTLSGSNRQAHWEWLIEEFYEYFLDALGNHEAPYTLKQLKESYRLYFVTGGLLMMPLFTSVAQTKLTNLNNNDDQDEEHKEVLTEKVERLMEDLVIWHLYSRNVIQEHQEQE